MTFLFTDVEGSTRLLREIGPDNYAAALGEHRQVLRDACRRFGGVEVDTQGDAFFIAFPTAPGAVAAAGEAQAALPIAVRMGVHTGTPLLTDEGYVGMDVHEAARIASAGHGGQILVSTTTAELIGGDQLRDLGEHRLKDLSAAVRIFQVGDGEFPPLKTLYRTNLPVPSTSFVGRAGELAQLRETLERDDVRLLTLTGPGGSGKTRIALQLAAATADTYPHGLWWVPLAPVSDADQVATAAARVLGGGGSLAELVGDRRLLLLLDNFEHVVAAAADVAALLAACPHVNLLVTSRERLRIAGEQVYPLPVLTPADARDLFVGRARAVRPDFEPDEFTDRICARLDELPLALELAAARTSLLTTRQLHERLHSRLDLLRGGRDADARQQTLRATIEWSYQLLEPAEQRLLAALSVFRSPWTIDAAERVADADLELLQSLLDKSLLRRSSSDRVGMLETIRDFAAEQLAEQDRQRLLGRLLEHLIDVFDAMNAGYHAKDAADIAAAQAERPNVDVVLAWAATTGAAAAGLSLLAQLEFYWPTNDPLVARDYVDRLLSAGGDQIAPSQVAQALRLRGATYDMTGQNDRAAVEFERAIEILRTIGDDAEANHLLHRIAHAALYAGDIERGVRLARQALEFDRQHDRPHDEAAALGVLSTAAFMQGDTAEGTRLGYESAAVAESVGFTWWKSVALITVAEHLFAADDPESACSALAVGLEASAAVDDRVNLPYALAFAAALAARRENAAVAGLLWGSVEAAAVNEPRPTTASALLQYEPQLNRVRGAEYDEARERGRALTIEVAVAHALDFARAPRQASSIQPKASN